MSSLPPVNVVISIADQMLYLVRADKVVNSWLVSTAAAGVGNEEGSHKTPLGEHRIRAKIGEGAPIQSVFVGRRLTGEVYTETLASKYPERDWILSRILWLCGNEPGVNRFGTVDSMRRYIYIHGTPDTESMGAPRSHGCIRMRNSNVMALFGLVNVDTPVRIIEPSYLRPLFL